jgi:septum site-determining protein MinD
MPKIIGIVSGKGGVGKTTVTANLGMAMANQGTKVTLVDCNVTASHLGFLFGIYYYDKTLNDVLHNLASVQEATYEYKGLNIIPASPSLNSLIDLDLSRLYDCLKQVNSDTILLDAAPGLGREPMSVLQSSNEILFVTTPYLNAVTDVVKTNEVLSRLGIKVLGIVLNMVKGLPHELSKREVERLTGLEVLEEIPYDETVNYALSVSRPVVEFYPFSPSSTAFNRLAAKVTGNVYLLKKESIFSRIKSSFARLTVRKRVVDVRELI